MAADMFRQNEIARAIRMLCQGATALTADASGGDQVSVGSNEMFEVGQQVRLRDAAGEEEKTVSGLVGLTTVKFTEAISGEYLVSRGARLEWADNPLGTVQWVGQGSPELMPRSPVERFPCVLVLPGEMHQPLNEGTNRTFQQDYSFRVYYVMQHDEGQRANIEVLDRAATLFNVLMADPYLGGTCWHSQVTRVDPDPAVQERLREDERPLRVVELTVMARRAALWKPA
ncbi:MAG: hypothetical protein U9R79_05280 [Armatimonadota bacterium]|nr:hypothetical protein [Armatimonadota bacterium]